MKNWTAVAVIGIILSSLVVRLPTAQAAEKEFSISQCAERARERHGQPLTLDEIINEGMAVLCEADSGKWWPPNRNSECIRLFTDLKEVMGH